MKCIILAGGLGTRLAEETVRIPKPMVEIGGFPILWHIMKIYSAHGINEFIICLGYRGYVIKEFFANYLLHRSDAILDLASGDLQFTRTEAESWKIHLVDTGQASMTGGRLKRVLPLVAEDEAFCLTYGDGVGNVDLAAELAFHKSHGKLATVAAVPPPRRFGQLDLNGDLVSSFSEKPLGEGGLINGGFFVLSPEIGKYLEDDSTIWEREPLTRLAADEELVAFTHRGFWQPMDTIRERSELEELWASGNAPWKIW
ncbi:MAG: glucose-1-phosphate cytidylyltransferase [Mangrovicoccus sp.]